ncbi:hypothetical protein WA1_12425 [Scytonema hofmannii PCC 7110]|uniref:Ribbon-helix-helix protein CopG domain-containing protein n=1 Tax=Scytonema hofmannii PCC 7110 TaxID=128403 RepID=A0A139XE19_9CYAN|nr:hypothetical protein [Scytonema hofmannii]KYC42916.1 hypothetical protein WA1_12425 [Scytonema hofmannii PCC 7110]
MTNAQEIVHLNLDLSPELNQVLEEVAKKIGGTKSDVLRQGITLMQMMAKAKEQTQKLGITEAHQHTASERSIPLEDVPKNHPLEMFMESFGAWEDDRTPEEIAKDIYETRSTSDRDYNL